MPGLEVCTDLPLQLHMNRRRYEGRTFICHAQIFARSYDVQVCTEEWMVAGILKQQ